MRVCPDCQTKVQDSAIFCETCGYPLGAGPSETVASSSPVERTVAGEVKPGTCSSCGYQNVAGEMFCLNCGVQLAPVASIPPPLPRLASQVGLAPAPGATFWQCPVCYAPLEPEADYCENCGTNLSASGAQPAGALEPVEPGSLVAPPKIAIHLVVQSNNSVILLDMRHDEWLVGRADPARGIYPEVDLSAYGGNESGVSRRHARLVEQEGQRFLIDLNSTNFTFLNGEKLQPGRQYLLKFGDEIRFGLLTLTYFEESAT